MLKKVIRLVLFLTVIFFIFEIGLRIFHPAELGPVKFSFHKDLGFIPVPNQSGSNYIPDVYNYSFTNDASGRRITSQTKMEASQIKKRILLLGDSFTYGIGVDDEETFAYKFQQMVSEDGIQIANGGIQGMGTDYALKYYRAFKEEVKPDVVIYFAHFNDALDTSREYYFELGDDDQLKTKSFSGSFSSKKEILQNSKLYNWLISNLHVFSFAKEHVVAWLKPEFEIEFGDEEFDEKSAYHFTTVVMNKLVEEIRADSVELITYYIPAILDIEAGLKGKTLETEQYFKDYCLEKGVKYNSFTKELINLNPKIDALYLKEGHWTEEGHTHASKLLKNYLDGFY